MPPLALLLALALHPGDRPESVELRRYGWNVPWTSVVAPAPDAAAVERQLLTGFGQGFDAAVVTLTRRGVRGRVYVPLFDPARPPALALGPPRDGWRGFRPLGTEAR